MRDIYLKIEDVELWVEYSVVDADDSAGIPTGYAISKITLNECEQAVYWREKFSEFKAGYHENISISSLQMMALDSSEEDFEFAPFRIGGGFVDPDMREHVITLATANLRNITLINHAISQIADFVFTSWFQVEVTDLFDHLQIELLIKVLL